MNNLITLNHFCDSDELNLQNSETLIIYLNIERRQRKRRIGKILNYSKGNLLLTKKKKVLNILLDRNKIVILLYEM